MNISRRTFIGASLATIAKATAADGVEPIGPRLPVGPQASPAIPQGAITVLRTDAIQTKATASPEGAVLALEGGVHYPTGSITLKNRQQLWGQPDSVIDGKGKKQAFNLGNRTGLLLKNFGVRNYKPLGDSPAIEGGQTAWGTAENLDIGGIDGCGIRVSTLRACHLHDITVVGYSILYQQGALIEDCLIEKVNLVAKRLSGVEGGGKSWSSVGSVIRHNRFSEIYGNCIWFDYNNDLAVVQYNDIAGGVGHGVFLEISYRADVRYNRIAGVRNLSTQGGGQRCAVAIVKTQGVNGSIGAQVQYNSIEDCSIGVGILEEAKESGQKPRYDIWQTRNAHVEFNTLTNCDMCCGFWNWGGNPLESGDNNRFDYNTYKSPRLAKPFQYMNSTATWGTWQGKGYDKNGTMG